MKTISAVAASALVAILMVVPAQAIMMQDQYGSVYTLSTNSPTLVNGQQLQYEVTLTIDPSYYSGKYLSISAVDFKITPGTGRITDAIVVSSPTGGWSTSFESLNSKNICDGDGDSGFVCSQGTPIPFTADNTFNAGNPPLTWTWDITLAAGVDLLDGLYGAHLGAKYGDAGVNGQITSLTYAPVPEPSTLLLLGSGLLGLGGFAWRRNRKR